MDLCGAISLKVIPAVLTLRPLVEGFRFLEVSIGVTYLTADAQYSPSDFVCVWVDSSRLKLVSGGIWSIWAFNAHPQF